MPFGIPTLIVPAPTSRSARHRADLDGALLDGHAQAVFCPVHRDVLGAVADHGGADALADLDLAVGGGEGSRAPGRGDGDVAVVGAQARLAGAGEVDVATGDVGPHLARSAAATSVASAGSAGRTSTVAGGVLTPRWKRRTPPR
ncbi:hypothetical protein [Nonomuraea rosea]|uniref:hypothetical protein n=1 Tax=Nonomuraea rosea TaxID=638574 RepID=UPI0031E5B809